MAAAQHMLILVKSRSNAGGVGGGDADGAGVGVVASSSRSMIMRRRAPMKEGAAHNFNLQLQNDVGRRRRRRRGGGSLVVRGDSSFNQGGAATTTAAAASSTASFSSPSVAKPLVVRAEEFIEQAIFNCRFLTLLGVVGSLAGSVLCFFKGCWFVVESFTEYFQGCLRGVGTGKVILMLVEAVDVYLMGTVMLIFGMGLYELFVSSLEVPGGNCFSSGRRTTVCGSNLFGLFRLRERPKWLEIHSLDELKTKLGHVIVMILLVGMFEKSKKVPVHTGADLLCFSASVLLSSGCLYLLSKLHPPATHG